MATSFEDALGIIEDEEGLDRSGALERIKQFAQQGEETILAIPDLQKNIENEERIRGRYAAHGRLESAVVGAVSGAVRPFAKLGEWAGSETAGRIYREALAASEYQPHQVSRILGEIAGSTIPVNAATNTLRMGGMAARLAGAAARIPQPTISAIRAGGIVGEKAATAMAPQLARANKIEQALNVGIGAAAIGFASPEDPLTGAAIGAVLPGLSLIKSLRGGAADNALQYIARASHRSTAQVKAEWEEKTANELRSNLVQSDAPASVIGDLDRALYDEGINMVRPSAEPMFTEGTDIARKTGVRVPPAREKLPKIEGAKDLFTPPEEGKIVKTGLANIINVSGREVAPGKIISLLAPKGTAELPPALASVQLKKPLIVPVQKGGIIQDQVIRALYGNTKEADDIVRLTEFSGLPRDTRQYNELLDEFIRRKGVQRGYDGIVVQHENPVNDITYHFAGMPARKIKTVSELIEQAKVIIHTSAERVGQSISENRGLAKDIYIPEAAPGAGAKLDTAIDDIGKVAQKNSAEFAEKLVAAERARPAQEGKLLGTQGTKPHDIAAEITKQAVQPLEKQIEENLARDLMKDEGLSRENALARARKILGSERGSTLGPPPKGKIPQGGGTYLQYDKDSKKMALLYDGDIKSIFHDDPVIKEAIGSMNMGLKNWATLRPIWGASDNPWYLQWVSRMIDSKKDILGKKLDDYSARAQELLEKFKIGDKLKHTTAAIHYDDFIEAAMTANRQADGSIIQTAKGLPSDVVKAAEEMRKLDDEMWTLVTGIDARVPAIFEQQGLEYSKRNIQRVRQIQEYTRGRSKILPTKIKNEERVAAGKAMGYMDYDDTHDISVLYKQGHFSMLPHEQEEAMLVERISQLTADKITQAKAGGYLADIQAGIDGANARLQAVRKLKADLAAGRGNLPLTGVIPRKQTVGALSVARNPVAEHMLYETDVPKILSRYVNDIVSKRYFDVVLHDANVNTLPNIESGHLRAFVKDVINAQRGIRGYKEDLSWARGLDWLKKVSRGKLIGAPDQAASLRQMREATRIYLKMQFISKIALFPVRFPVLNLTQTGLTVAPVTGIENWVRAIAKLGSKDAWDEVRAARVITNVNRGIQEIEGLVPSRLHKLEQVFNYMPLKTENINKFIAYHAGKMAALDDGFRPLRSMKLFMPTADKTENAIRYAKAVVDHTQFIYGPEAKPLAFSGGISRRVIGQFKTFPIMYGSLLSNLILQDGRVAGNWKPAATAIGSLVMFGGLPAIPGMSTLIDTIKPTLLRNGIDPSGLEQTGLGAIVNQAGYNSPIDISYSIEPFNLPQISGQSWPDFAAGVGSYIGGPAVGTVKNFYDIAANPEHRGKMAARALSPYLGAAGEAISEYQTGGVRSPGGELQIKQSNLQLWARGINMRPSPRMLRYMYARDIENAMIGGQHELVAELIKEAEADGLYFGKRAKASIKANATKYHKAHKGGFIERHLKWEQLQ